ncbi:Protein-hormone receptor, partial [Dermatophagoides pteronyssinus]
ILSSNRIQRIEQEYFGHKFWYKDLNNLLLNQNLLTTIPNATFIQFKSLQYLNLASNRLTKLHPLSFFGLNKLLKLDLGSNKIKTFPLDSISPKILPNLNEINLRQNFIKVIPAQAFIATSINIPLFESSKQQQNDDFNYKSHIINFDLSSNPIQKFASDSFVHMPRLHKIYFSEIRSQRKFPNLNGTNSVEHIRLDRMQIESIDQRLCENVGKTLKSLIVKSNRIDRLPPMDFCIELRLLDASYNEIKSIDSKSFYNQHKLIDLSLSHNQIEMIAIDSFDGLVNLKVLNMESNRIQWIDSNAFRPLRSLRDLNLGHNTFSELPTAGLIKILELKVHGNQNLRNFPPIESFPYVQTLAMSYAYHCCSYQNRMQIINPEISNNNDAALPSVSPSTINSNSDDSFQDSILWLEDIDDSNVNLTITELAQQFWKLYHQQQAAPIPNNHYDVPNSNNNFDMFVNDFYAAIETPAAVVWGDMIDSDEFAGNDKSSSVYFQQNDRITNKPIKCLPKPDPFMPCQDLFDWWTLRFGVWLVFPLALIGNGTVLIVLIFGRRRKRRRSSSSSISKLDVPRFLVCNLAAADFFMGIYLGMLALVDLVTLGYFRSYAIRWQNSFVCQLTGFAGVFSAELSVYTLAVITLERNYAITHAMHLNKRLSFRAAIMVMSFGWFFALSMALLPLFGISDYRKVAVCLPFDIDNLLSFIYIISLIIFNGIAFLLLIACYLRMYCAIRGSQAWNSNDTRIAMRMGLLVFTDFLCWAPIAFFTITTLAGWNLITIEEAKIFTIFILPLNACANPFLYAFFTKQFKKECTNLYKRVDASKLFRRSQHRSCFGRRQQQQSLVITDPLSPQQQQQQEMSDCKICIHNHHLDERISDSPDRHHSDDVNEIINPINPMKNENHDCHCDCHNNRIIISSKSDNDINKRKNRIRSIESDQIDRRSSSSYTSQFIRQFIPRSLMTMNKSDNLPNNNNRPLKKSSIIQGKQFKSNSIIYQSNYRKNHIHMTLENELKSPIPPPPTTTISDHNNQKKKQMPTNNKTNSSSSSSSSSSNKHDDNNKQSDEDIHNENDHRQNNNAIIMIVNEQNTNDNNNVEYQLSKCNRHHYVKHHHHHPNLTTTTNAMTTGILMLKNKFIRHNPKNYVRKMSTDSQYEFSYYSNRKDSTSTTNGRLSFSSGSMKEEENDYFRKKFDTITNIDCIEHKLIDKFMENLSANKSFRNFQDDYFENLAIHSMVFECRIRLACGGGGGGRELDEINEETNSQTNGNGSNNRLQEESLNNINIKKSQTSLIQLQVIESLLTSPTNSQKSDSIIQEIRSRSAISDVIIRINHSPNSNIVDNQNDLDDSYDKISTLQKPKQTTLSDREISYNSQYNNDDDNNFNENHNNKHRYHSYEFIMNNNDPC